MPDPTDFNTSQFTSPQQVELMRRYAAQLLEPLKPGDVASHWTGALAAALRGAMGPMIANRATQLQQIGLQGAAQQDPNLAMLQSRGLLGQNAPASVPGQSAQPMSFAGTPDLKASTLMQESGNRSNIGPSVAGAIGPGQIMPATFASVARPGENINNPSDNRTVSGRLLDNYMQKYGDPARAAVAYFSGEGNVAPPGSSVPWKRDIADQNGKTVSSYVSDVVGRMGGQQVAQASPSYSAYQHNPWANPKEQDLARGMVAPSTGVDVYGNPVASNIMGGVQAQPVGPGATPGYRAPVTVGAEGQVSTEVPFPAPRQHAAPQSLQERLQPLVTMGQQFGQQGAANRAIQAQTGEEIKTGFASFPVIQSLNTMEDLIKKHGENMPFGPTAEWVNELKRGLAQHAPGLFNEKDFQGLAAADELKKLSAWLSTAVGRQAGGTDLSLLQGRDSVPGQHNSKEGALSLIDMMRQVQMLNARFAMDNMNSFGKPGFNLLAAKERFFSDHPIINNLTGNPIRVDLSTKNKQGQTPEQGGSWSIVR